MKLSRIGASLLLTASIACAQIASFEHPCRSRLGRQTGRSRPHTTMACSTGYSPSTTFHVLSGLKRSS